MSVNVPALAKALVGGKIDLTRATEIIDQAIFLIEIVEDAYDNLKGNEKLKAVVNGVLGLLRYVFPDEAEDFFADVSRKLAPIISMVVTIYNLRNLWPAKAIKTSDVVWTGGNA